MKRFIGMALFSLFVSSATVFAASPPKVNPEPLDLEAGMLAKIAKEKSKSSSLMHVMTGNARDRLSDDSCGSVNINSNNSDKSNSGIKEMFGKQSTTIVTGPVINMASCN